MTDTLMSSANTQLAPRFRINAKQKSSGEWYLDATAETFGADYVNIHDPKDQGKVVRESVSKRLLDMITETEDAFIAQGRVLMGAPRGKHKK